MWRGSGLREGFFITDSGFTDTGPKSMREDDITAVPFGGKVPFVLRPIENGY
jgi:hypothetical protein